MSSTESEFDYDSAVSSMQTAVADGQLSDTAVDNIKVWLNDSHYAEYAPAIMQHIRDRQWRSLDDAFWTVIPFGTGGRRGRMYPFGSNAINDRTIGESAQGLAEYVKSVKPDGPWSFAIAYDTRHRSRHFAELCAGIMVANGFEVFFIDGYRSTPELSFLIRYRDCDCGIMVTASHNPPSDNAVKVYWSTGGQLVPPHDSAVIEKVGKVKQIDSVDFEQAVDDGRIHLCRDEIDNALLQAHLEHSFPGPRNLKVIYSPLHGVGEFNVKSLLTQAGFKDLEIYEPHREPNGDFPNVPGHVSNPENREVFTSIIDHARQSGAELILASDPDCDRMGAAAPLTLDPSGDWATLNGNQLGVLLADYVLSQKQAAGQLTTENFIVTTLVTTMMANRIAEHFGIRCFNENLVGFKWICAVMDHHGADKFVYGFEESHGYLVGSYARDKDGAIACLLISELAARVKGEGKSLHQHLDGLYMKYGFHEERLLTLRMEGSDGMKRMERVMDRFRSNTPSSMGGLPIHSLRDYSVGKRIFQNGTAESIEGPTGNLVMLETDQAGNYVAARPSGTEPKIKFYMFTHVPAGRIEDLDAVKHEMSKRLDSFAVDLQSFADSVE